MKRDQVLQMASAHNISTVYEVENNYLETWVWKPKGILDVCYDRGILDLDKFDSDDFNKRYQKGSYGQIIEGTNISGMLGSCTDITEEETLLQTYCKLMGVKCDISPKFYPEVAGEGIDYIWGNANMVFRIIPLKNIKSVADFRLQVKIVISKEVLSIDIVQTNYIRAREYIFSYFCLSIVEEQQVSGDNG